MRSCLFIGAANFFVYFNVSGGVLLLIGLMLVDRCTNWSETDLYCFLFKSIVDKILELFSQQSHFFGNLHGNVTTAKNQTHNQGLIKINQTDKLTV